MFCFSKICPYELINCILNFCILFSNSISMALTCYNLKEITEASILYLTLGALITSMFCVSVKQASGIERYVKLDYFKQESSRI